MAAQLRVIIDDRIEKLVLPSGIPPTVEDLQTIVKENFEIPYEFSLQYLDSEFQDYFTLNQSDEVKHKDTIKVVHAAPNVSNLLPQFERLGIFGGQQSTDVDSASYGHGWRCSVQSSTDVDSDSYAESTDVDSASYAELSASCAESSAGTSSSQDTIIRPSTEERHQPWPKEFPIPKFAYETEMYLERATEDYKRNGPLMTYDLFLKVKKDILKKLAETIYEYAAYPSPAQIGDVVEALLGKCPCLERPSSSYAWQQSLKNKMRNYRKKLRGDGLLEVECNALKSKNPEDQKSAKNVKKPRKGEVNFLPPYPAGEDEQSQEQERIQLLTEVGKKIKEKMAKTFAHKRNGVMNRSLSIEDIKARWPALFEASYIQYEFRRITTKDLESTFMSKLDEYTPRLLNLFRSKGGKMGSRLQAILPKLNTNPDIDITRDVVIRCLMVYLGESTDQLLKEYDDSDEEDVSQDRAEQSMKIYIKTPTSEGPDDISIVVGGITVMTALGTFPRACFMLVGLAYALNLAYPKELRYTFEVFQTLFLELICSKLSPKVNSLNEQLAKKK